MFRMIPFVLLAALVAPATAGAATPEQARALITRDGQVWEPDGWTLEEVQAGPEQALYRYRHAEGWDVVAVVESRDDSRPTYATSLHLSIFYTLSQGEADEARERRIDALMSGFAQRVQANDSAELFERVERQLPAAPAAVAPEIEQALAARAEAGARLVHLDMLLWFFGIAAVLALLVLLGRELARWPRAERLGVLGFVLAGGLVRWFVAPHVPVKVGMVYPFMESVLSLHDLPRYGAAGPVLYNLLLQVLPVHVDSILWFHSVLGTLTVLVLVAFGRRFLGLDRAGTLWAAAILALTPVFIRDANSESQLVPALFLLAGGGWLVQEFLAQRKAWFLGAALPLLALASHMRPELLLIVPLFTLATVLPGLARDRRLLWLGGLAVALMVLALPYLAFFLRSLDAEVATGNLAAGKLNPLAMLGELFQRNMLIRPAIFPAGVSLLALAGIVFAWVRRQHRVAATGLLVVLLAWMTVYYVDFNEESMLRLHVPAAMLAALLAALGASHIQALGTTDSVPPRRGRGEAAGGRLPRRLVPLALAVLVAGSAVPNLFVIFFETNAQKLDRQFDSVVAALPDEPVNFVVLTGDDVPNSVWAPQTLAAAGRTLEGRAEVHRFVPTYLLQPPLREDTVLSIRQWMEKPLRPGRTFFYLSPHCYAMREQHGDAEWGLEPDPTVRMHPACRWMLMHHHLEPVHLEWMENVSEYSPPFQWYPPQLAGMPVGLLEVRRTLSRPLSKYTFASLAGTWFNRAKEHLVKGELEPAGEVLREGEKVLRDISVTYLEHLGNYYFLLGATTKDQEALRKGLDYWLEIASRDIHYPLVLKNISSVFSVYSEGLPHEEVRSAVNARLEADPEDIVGLWLKGMLLFYNDQDYAGSLALLERVLEVVDNDPRVYVYVSLDHFYLDHMDKAREMVERAIEVAGGSDPDAYYVRSIIVRQENLPMAIADIQRYLDASAGADKVKYEKKQKWLRKELENLKQGKMSSWWTTDTKAEPWKE